MTFIGIWFNTSTEVKRDRVEAKDAEDASNKLHAMYAGRQEPARCLTVTPASGYGVNQTICEVN